MLNTEIVTDFQNLFSSFFIDVRDIENETKLETDKSGLIKLFENLINGNLESKNELRQMIHPSTNAQYERGI